MLDIYGKRITLRYNGEEYFKTRCGACATVTLVMTLVIVALLHFRNIYLGKIDRFDYVIHNQFLENYWIERGRRFPETHEILAFGFEDESLIHDMHLQFRGFILHKNQTEENLQLTKCTDEVLSNMNRVTLPQIPTSIHIRCLRVPMEHISSGGRAKIIF